MSRTAELIAAIEAAQKNAAAYRSLSPQARRELAESNLQARRLNRPDDVRSPSEAVLEKQLAAIMQSRPWAEDEGLLERVDLARPLISEWLDRGFAAIEHERMRRAAIDGDYSRRLEAQKLDAKIAKLEAEHGRLRALDDISLYHEHRADLERRMEPGVVAERFRVAQMGVEGERRRVRNLTDSERNSPIEVARAQTAQTENAK